MKKFKNARIIFWILLTQGCGYQWREAEERPTLAIPFIPGDEDGTLTNEIIRTISASGIAKVHREGKYRLEVHLKDTQIDTIGYRRDKQKVSGKVSTNIVATEQRKSLSLEASIYDQDNRLVFGPCTVSSNIEYDFIDGDSIQDLLFINPKGVPTTVLPFSLGQLEPVEAAQEAASRPIYQKLARKIGEFVTQFTHHIPKD